VREDSLAKKALILKCRRKQKYSVREYNRCQRCGRPRGYLRDFGICRICFREMALEGKIPGVRKASW
jgi:small subunit ribosomal protein S14